MDIARFELVSWYADRPELLPTRATQYSGGYDFSVAQDIVVPSYQNYIKTANDLLPDAGLFMNEVAQFTKENKIKPTLVPTGIKAYLPDNTFLQISVRSSCPLKHWLILANGVGIIDKDYYNNPDNEGHIFFQIINLFPRDILLKQGDKIGQGIILPYALAAGDDTETERTGGLGSTSL